MLRATATEAKDSLGSLLARVRGGETVLITSHGTPIATISPISEKLLGDKEKRIADLVAEGILTPPQRTLDPEEVFSKNVPVLPPDLTAVDHMDWERDGH